MHLEEASQEEIELQIDQARLRPRFIELAQIYPGMDVFQPPRLDSAKTAELVLNRMEELAKTVRGRKFLYWWLGSTMRSATEAEGSVIFHSSLVLHTAFAKDIDIFLMGCSVGHPRLDFVDNTHEKIFGRTGGIMSQFFMANSLLIFNPQNRFLESIGMMRKAIETGNFLEKGIGAMLIFAAYKVWRNSEWYHVEAGDRELIRPLVFDVTWETERRDGDIGSEQITPLQLNAQIREKMQDLPDGNLMALTKAAIRRIRIREDRKEEIAGRFVRELRTNKVSKGSWFFR